VTIAVTYFDDKIWFESGVNWLRHAKSAGYTGFIVQKNLAKEAVTKCNDLGFDVVPLIENSYTRYDFYSTFFENLKTNESCLVTIPNTLPKKIDAIDSDCMCHQSDKNIYQIITPVSKLQDRADIFPLLENVKKTYSNFFSADSIFGNYDFWSNFLKFQNYLMQKNYLEANPEYDDFALNFFLANINSIKIKKWIN